MKPTPRYKLIRIVCVFAFLAAAIHSVNGQVTTYGRLRVSGNKIVDKNGTPVSFAGNSLFWGNNGWGGEKYWNANVVNFLKTNWKTRIVRAAMGVEDSGGYISDPAGNKAKVKRVVDACIAAGVYVIIDWHSHNANQYQSQAVSFFTEMAQTYGGYDNVMYEIWNEPTSVSWSGVVKPYAQAVINAIRSKDPDNMIIVGSPTWSQDVDVATADPLTDSNVAYTLHFYAGTHSQSLRDKAQIALNRGKPLFITEWGTCAASGAGSVDTASTDAWVNWMRINGLSHCNWAINDKAEAASALKPGASTSGGWADADLTASGLLVRSIVQNWDLQPTSLLYEAELIPTAVSTDAMTVVGEAPASNGAIEKLASNAVNDYATYSLWVPKTGTYGITVRVKTNTTRGKFQLAVENYPQGAVQDEYGSEGYVTYNLGTKTFNAAPAYKSFKFTIVGKNASSTGYDLTFDYIKLTK